MQRDKVPLCPQHRRRVTSNLLQWCLIDSQQSAVLLAWGLWRALRHHHHGLWRWLQVCHPTRSSVFLSYSAFSFLLFFFPFIFNSLILDSVVPEICWATVYWVRKRELEGERTRHAPPPVDDNEYLPIIRLLFVIIFYVSTFLSISAHFLWSHVRASSSPLHTTDLVDDLPIFFPSLLPLQIPRMQAAHPHTSTSPPWQAQQPPSSRQLSASDAVDTKEVAAEKGGLGLDQGGSTREDGRCPRKRVTRGCLRQGSRRWSQVSLLPSLTLFRSSPLFSSLPFIYVIFVGIILFRTSPTLHIAKGERKSFFDVAAQLPLSRSISLPSHSPCPLPSRSRSPFPFCIVLIFVISFLLPPFPCSVISCESNEKCSLGATRSRNNVHGTMLPLGILSLLITRRRNDATQQRNATSRRNEAPQRGNEATQQGIEATQRDERWKAVIRGPISL